MQLLDGLFCIKPLSYHSIHSFRYGTLHSQLRLLSLWILGKDSRGRQFFWCDNPTDPNTSSIEIPYLNGPVYTSCKILVFVVGSVAEAEIGDTYHIKQEACPIVTTLEELGHPQYPTLLQVDNTTAEGYSNETINTKRSKYMDNCYHWVQDHVYQKQFLVYFFPGTNNLADPFTKNHHHEHCCIIHPKYLLPNKTTTLTCAAISLIYERLLR